MLSWSWDCAGLAAPPSAWLLMPHNEADNGQQRERERGRVKGRRESSRCGPKLPGAESDERVRQARSTFCWATLKAAAAQTDREKHREGKREAKGRGWQLMRVTISSVFRATTTAAATVANEGQPGNNRCCCCYCCTFCLAVWPITKLLRGLV